MDIQVWQQLSEIKTNILYVACELIEDEKFTREEAALDLICLCQNLKQLEDECLKAIRKTSLPQLGRKVEQIQRDKGLRKEKALTTAK
ncbi:hypothetical protein [Brevibacillus agri]|uniref:hypothetical protein n=1 Tax=Brevibacillus agri TaxID=51101 RepID=UPI003D1A883D